MAQLPLTPQQIQVIFQSLTLAMLGWPATGYDRVRVVRQPQGQPAWRVDEDIVWVYAHEHEDWYNSVRDVISTNLDDATLQVTWTYQRIWQVDWTAYGPNSFDNIRQIKSGLFYSTSHDTLAASELYAVTDFSTPMRLPEVYEGQWWERVDFTARFNEWVTEVQQLPRVQSVEVAIYKQPPTGSEPAADFTVTKP